MSIRVFHAIPETSRFWLKVWPRGDCWEWRGKRAGGNHPQRREYGRFVVGDGRFVSGVYAHRYAYEQAKGPILPGMSVHHECSHPWCVKPTHLVLMDHGEHMGLRKLKRA